MSYVVLLVFSLCILAAGALGYLLGRYQSHLVNEIRTLREQGRQPVLEKPVVVLGDSYAPPRQVSTAPDNRNVGLVESKTPQRLDWEADQAIEAEARGHVQIGPT